jgi:hypothetical protein
MSKLFIAYFSGLCPMSHYIQHGIIDVGKGRFPLCSPLPFLVKIYCRIK